MALRLLIGAVAVVCSPLAVVSALGQQAGSIVGWGSRIVLPPSKGTQMTTRSPTVLCAVMLSLITTASAPAQPSGSIVAWGYNGFGLSSVPAPNTGFVAIAAGDEHSLGLKSDGSIAAWGDNSYAQSTVPAPNS